jgi:hypothetical protein
MPLPESVADNAPIDGLGYRLSRTTHPLLQTSDSI